MSNVIEFLDAMGRDAQLRHADAGTLAVALEQAQIDPALRAAVLSGDQQRLESLLGARTNVVCGFAPAQDDDSQEKAPDDDEEIVASAARVA
jgi:hypothetical protein